MTDARPQDQDRPHRRRGAPSAATVTLLTAYQAAMRDELRGVLSELAGQAPEPGLLDGSGITPTVLRPPLADRMRLWDLAIKLARELGAAIELPPPEAAPAAARKPRARAIDYR